MPVKLLRLIMSHHAPAKTMVRGSGHDSLYFEIGFATWFYEQPRRRFLITPNNQNGTVVIDGK